MNIRYNAPRSLERFARIGMNLYQSEREALDAKLAADNIQLTHFIRSCINAYIAGDLTIS